MNPNAQPTSKDVEKFQTELRIQASHHQRIVSGITKVADALNGLADVAESKLGEAIAEPANLLLSGLGDVLQGFSDIHASQADNLTMQSEGLTPAIEQLKTQEAGIVVPTLTRRRPS